MKYATAQRDGYTVPMIGVPLQSQLETCDLCGELFGLREIVLVGTEFLCARKCAVGAAC